MIKQYDNWKQKKTNLLIYKKYWGRAICYESGMYKFGGQTYTSKGVCQVSYYHNVLKKSLMD